MDELNLELLYSGYAANIYCDLRDLGRDQHARHAAALGGGGSKGPESLYFELLKVYAVVKVVHCVTFSS